MTAPAWRSLPQPTAFEPTGDVWRAAAVRVVPADGAGPAGADDAGFAREAERLRAELQTMGVRVVTDTKGHAPGVAESGLPFDATITLRRQDHTPEPEAFDIVIDDDVVITASSAAGVFRATRSIIQQLRTSGSLPRGRVASVPAVRERGVHLDAARAFYPASWIISLLHRMSELGLNTFQWHFSENEGVRLERPGHPGFASAEHITLDEAKRIIVVAASLHIEIVPSLDMPGHLRHALRDRPALRLDDDDRALDISRPDAVAFARRLVADYLPVFAGSSRWTIGADEFLDVHRTSDPPHLVAEAVRRFGPDASSFDLLTAFVDDIAAEVRTAGFVPRVWNDGMFRAHHVPLASDAEIAWWTNWFAPMRPLARALDEERTLLNFDDAHLYYVLGEAAGYRYPTAERLWDDRWHPGLFPGLPDGGRQELTHPYPSALRGTYFSIWSDRPNAQTPDEVMAGIEAPLAAFAERAWNGGSALTLEQFHDIRR